jgi:hypothetical protein
MRHCLPAMGCRINDEGPVGSVMLRQPPKHPRTPATLPTLGTGFERLQILRSAQNDKQGEGCSSRREPALNLPKGRRGVSFSGPEDAS